MLKLLQVILIFFLYQLIFFSNKMERIINPAKENYTNI
jgi:hypothetical protein